MRKCQTFLQLHCVLSRFYFFLNPAEGLFLPPLSASMDTLTSSRCPDIKSFSESFQIIHRSTSRSHPNQWLFSCTELQSSEKRTVNWRYSNLIKGLFFRLGTKMPDGQTFESFLQCFPSAFLSPAHQSMHLCTHSLSYVHTSLSVCTSHLV